MLVIPAIDLLGGKVVRLVEGKRERATVYSDAPGEVAARFVAEGAARIHVVDLDGAFNAGRENIVAVQQIVACGAPVQVGGGVRGLADCRRLLDEGAAEVVLGTVAVKEPRLLEEAGAELRARLIVAVDARDGRVVVEGWTETTSVDALALAGRAAALGVAGVLYTDVRRDGTGVGPNVAASAELARAIAPVPLIASGGIGALEHLRALQRAGVPRVVVGRALYERQFTVAEAIEAAR
jgi:phosphoribosylformimino-5-aminoimidazole carboxamide ribotide isomerase